MIRHAQLLTCLISLSIFQTSCQFAEIFEIPTEETETERIEDVGGNPSAGSQDIYSVANLNDLCIDHDECLPSYNLLPFSFKRTTGQQPLDVTTCNFDYDPNLTSTFILNRVDGSVNGLSLFLSKEDLFFIAWVSVRYRINPYFLLGVMAQESRGNCSAVSPAGGEGCFQITNTFGQDQLDDSYLDRVESWFWTDRDDSYYPADIFVDEVDYFGSLPPTEQLRLTRDPSVGQIDDTEVSSVINFNFGIIASALYFHWQPYLLYYNYSDLREVASAIFQDEDGKALWQVAAYNGGAYGASLAMRSAGEDYLEEMFPETRDYAPRVVDYCKSFQDGSLTYLATYTEDDLQWMIDLIAMTYPQDINVDWNEVMDDVSQVFFEDGTQELSFVDDIKAIVYVLSTHLPELAPEWPDEGSI